MPMNPKSLVFWLLSLALAPLLTGIVQRTKARFAGRKGAPWLQPYWDLLRLFRKSAVYSQTTTWVFSLAPLVICASVMAASLLLPWGGNRSVISFSGDWVVLVYLLGMARLGMIAAALDTGSSFEGMAASREGWVSILAEPVLFLSLAVWARQTHSLSLSDMSKELSIVHWGWPNPSLILLAGSLFIVALAENARLPVDDPATHLELTMIHEGMILDTSGPDLGWVLYAAMLKLWLLEGLAAGVLVPWRPDNGWLNGLAALGFVPVAGVFLGGLESVLARMRLRRVPQLLAGAGALAALAWMLS